MTSNERVKEIRKHNGLTMEEFGRRLGVTRTAISNIESSNRSLTEQMSKAICREFRVNEEWLRDGTGDMFVQRSRNQVIAEFLNEVMEDVEPSFRKRFIEALSVLDESDWAVLEKIADELAARKDK